MTMLPDSDARAMFLLLHVKWVHDDDILITRVLCSLYL